MRKQIIVILIILVILIASAVWFLLARRVDVTFANTGETIFRYGKNNVVMEIKKEDILSMKKIFNGKLLYKDGPSCGFTEDIAIVLDDSMTFCIARDTCPIIYFKEENMYFRITDEEQMELYRILGGYGFVFPCV